MSFSKQQWDFYQENGYVVVENLVPENVLQPLRVAITQLTEDISEQRGASLPKADIEDVSDSSGGTATAAKPAKPPLRKLNSICPVNELYRGVAASPAITDIACRLAGDAEHLLLYSDQVFLKPAFCGSEKPLHQDNDYFRVMPHTHGVTCWMAVDDATIENGCLNYIPGSHKLGLLKHKVLTPAHHTPDVDFPLNPEVPVPVKAGSCIFHHLLCLHNSKANISAKSRRAWALHYVNQTAECPYRKASDMIQMR